MAKSNDKSEDLQTQLTTLHAGQIAILDSINKIERKLDEVLKEKAKAISEEEMKEYMRNLGQKYRNSKTFH